VAGPDPPSVLMFLRYTVSNKRKSVVRRSYSLTIFLVSSSGLGQVPRSDPTSRDDDTARSPAMFASTALFLSLLYTRCED
jgi:hypothetical protein